MKVKNIQDPQILAKALIYASKNWQSHNSKQLLKKDLCSAFVWATTEEGNKYWDKLNEEYDEKKKEQRRQRFMEKFCI